MAADFHKTEDIMLMVNLKPDADKAAALAEVQDITKDYPQFTPHLTGEYRDELINDQRGVRPVLRHRPPDPDPGGIGVAEYADDQYSGTDARNRRDASGGGSRTQVRRMVTAEALLLGIFGAAMGVLAGVAMSYGFIMAFGTIGWKMPYTFPVGGVIAAMVLACCWRCSPVFFRRATPPNSTLSARCNTNNLVIGERRSWRLIIARSQNKDRALRV